MLLYEIAAWKKVAGYLIVQVDFKPNLFGFKAIPSCHTPLKERTGDICKGEMSFLCLISKVLWFLQRTALPYDVL